MNIIRAIKNPGNALWVFYFVFVAIAVATHDSEPVFSVAGPYGWGKAIVWCILAAFLIYSLHCSRNENFFKTMGKILPYYWFRQISYDLYIGIFLTLCLIYFNEGSLLVVALWFLPILLMANLATLVYIALNYQSLIAHFV